MSARVKTIVGLLVVTLASTFALAGVAAAESSNNPQSTAQLSKAKKKKKKKEKKTKKKVKTQTISQGRTGAQGLSGTPGSPGKNGERGSQGPAGKDGLNGRDGQNGRDGRDGADGVLKVASINWEADATSVSTLSSSWIILDTNTTTPRTVPSTPYLDLSTSARISAHATAHVLGLDSRFSGVVARSSCQLRATDGIGTVTPIGPRGYADTIPAPTLAGGTVAPISITGGTTLRAGHYAISLACNASAEVSAALVNASAEILALRIN